MGNPEIVEIDFSGFPTEMTAYTKRIWIQLYTVQQCNNMEGYHRQNSNENVKWQCNPTFVFQFPIVYVHASIQIQYFHLPFLN